MKISKAKMDKSCLKPSLKLNMIEIPFTHANNTEKRKQKIGKKLSSDINSIKGNPD